MQEERIEPMMMRKVCGALFSVAAVAAVAVSMPAHGGVFDDAVLLLQGDMDADGDGLITQGEAKNALNRNGSLGDIIDFSVRGSYDGTNKGISNPVAEVVMPRRGRTITSRVMRFKSQVTRYGDGRDAVWASGLALRNGFPVSDKMEMSAVIRFRWDGFVTDVDGENFNGATATLLTYGHGDDKDNNGIRCSLRLQTDGTTRLFFNNWSWAFSAIIGEDGWQIETGKWYDLAFTTKKGQVYVYLFPQGHWNYARVKKVSRTGNVFQSEAFGVDQESFGVAMATAHDKYDNNLFYPQESWSQSSIDNYEKNFNGDIHQIAVWNRVLSAEEIEEAFMGGESGDCQIGVVDGSNAEFSSGSASASSWTETDGWFRFKGGMENVGDSVSWSLLNRESRAHSRLMRVTLCAPTQKGSMSLSVNGTSIEAKSFAGAGDIVFDIPSSAVRPGEVNTFALTLQSGGQTAIDAIAVGGGFAIDNKGSEVDNDAHFLDEDPLNFTSYLTSREGHSFKNRLIYRFSLPNAFTTRRMRWTVTRGKYTGTDAAGYAVHVNDRNVYTSQTFMPEKWEFIVPLDTLKAGLNTLVISNLTTSATDSAYYSITSLTGEPLSNKGMVLVIR